MGKKGRRNNKQKKQSGQTSQKNQNRQQSAQTQQANTTPVPSGHGRSFSVPATQSILLPFVTDSLVRAVLSRGVPEHLDSFESLKAFLRDAFTAHGSLKLFFRALAQGLEGGAPQINQSVPIVEHSPDKMPLLIWVCQYKFLNSCLGCNLSDDVVELVLKAGADVNETLPSNYTSALFFAVKYSSVTTLDMLLKAGANVQQRDIFGRTCLHNALEHPNPLVLRRLLEHLPATEMLPSQNSPGGKEFLISTADALLNFLTTMNPPPPWINLGDPSPEHLLDAFMLIRERGARLTERGSDYSIKVIGVSIGTPHHPQIRNPKLLQKLSRALVGVNIPKEFQPTKQECEVSVEGLSVDEEPDACPICLDNPEKGVTLYCGHIFCRSCIMEYGKEQTNNGCPICRSQLCPELSETNRGVTLNHLLGINREFRQGPKYFTNEQLTMEAKAQGFYSIFSSYASLRSKLENELENGVRNSQQIMPLELSNVRKFSNKKGSSKSIQGRGRYILELASNATVAKGTPLSSVSICPNNGPVSIEISIHGTPMLARISNQCLYTVFSKSVVDQLGLKRIEQLTSKEFVDTCAATKIKSSTFTCLEPVKLCFEGIEVTLRNAVEMSPDPQNLLFGVQLGQDFLHSGLLSVIDVKIGQEEESNTYYRTIGENSWPASQASKESFRYYSHDGRMAELPLIHFDPFDQGVILGISLREDVKFSQCNWCCRVFPKGMLECERCSGCFYCDERCQKAAWKIHKFHTVKPRQTQQPFSIPVLLYERATGATPDLVA